MVCTSIASVANNLHSTNHLTNSEETQNLANDNSTGSELCAVEITNGGDDVGLAEEEGWVREALDEALEVGLEGGDLSRSYVSASSIPWELYEHSPYGGLIFCPWITSLESSRPTRA
jgi:hypothetical protein